MNGPSAWPPAQRRKPAAIFASLSGDDARPRLWRVIHACEYARDVLPTVEAQLAAGMRPYIVTPQGAGNAELYLSGRQQEQPRSLSLLRSWQDVRTWRKSILECDPENSADVVHAHSFASGMAAVRSIGGVVYDLEACIEELAISAGQCEPGSWMGRSFRVAEQFVVTRAATVVVHSSAMRNAARERGAAPENIFEIPHPIANDEIASGAELMRDIDALRAGSQSGEESVIIFAPHFASAANGEVSREQTAVLEGFALAARENANLRLIVETEAAESFCRTVDSASRLDVSERITVIDSTDSATAWQSADVVLAISQSIDDAVGAPGANQDPVLALARGKALLAGDTAQNRDATPEGRGCVWYEPGNSHDLARRLTFLARNPDFRRALGLAGRMYISDTRSMSAVGKKYQEAYQHAFSRRKSTGLGGGTVTLEPAANFG